MTFTVTDDTTVESDETATLELIAPMGMGLALNVRANAEIADNDQNPQPPSPQPPSESGGGGGGSSDLLTFLGLLLLGLQHNRRRKSRLTVVHSNIDSPDSTPRLVRPADRRSETDNPVSATGR